MSGTEKIGRLLMEGLEVGFKKVLVGMDEQIGDPVVSGTTMRIPFKAVRAVELEPESYQTVDQAWLDKNAPIIMQRLVLSLNGSDGPWHRRSNANFLSDPADFKLEWIDGGAVRISCTIVVDFSGLTSSVREVGWSMDYMIREMAMKKEPGKGIARPR